MPDKRELDAFFNGKVWKFLQETFETWIDDMHMVLEDPKLDERTTNVTRGNIETLRKIIALNSELVTTNEED